MGIIIKAETLSILRDLVELTIRSETTDMDEELADQIIGCTKILRASVQVDLQASMPGSSGAPYLTKELLRIALTARECQCTYRGEVSPFTDLHCAHTRYGACAQHTLDPSQTICPDCQPVCPDICPKCNADLAVDGYPIAHQVSDTGEVCSYRWV